MKMPGPQFGDFPVLLELGEEQEGEDQRQVAPEPPMNT